MDWLVLYWSFSLHDTTRGLGDEREKIQKRQGGVAANQLIKASGRVLGGRTR